MVGSAEGNTLVCDVFIFMSLLFSLLSLLLLPLLLLL